jgi:hypothetical protein
MGQSNRLTPEERAQITEIQDSLIDRYVKQKEAMEKRQKTRVSELDREIKQLEQEIEEIKGWANV